MESEKVCHTSEDATLYTVYAQTDKTRGFYARTRGFKKRILLEVASSLLERIKRLARKKQSLFLISRSSSRSWLRQGIFDRYFLLLEEDKPTHNT